MAPLCFKLPPFPECTSGHSVKSPARQHPVVLTRKSCFGDKIFAFTDSTEMEYGLSARSFEINSAALNRKAEISNMYGGIRITVLRSRTTSPKKSVGEFCGQSKAIKTRRKQWPRSRNPLHRKGNRQRRHKRFTK